MAVINARPGKVEVQIEGETNRFSFELNQKTFGLLVDKLYSNKIRAVIRELWTNALDSHVAHGCPERPFEVTLPNTLDPMFKVRDYGVSMDHDTVMRLYTTIGFSTSEVSNDFIGAMGLGSKSPFSYTDHFTVICWLNGEKQIYTAYYENDGVPAIKHVVTMPSDDEQGVEVSFAARPADFSEFEKEARYLAVGFDVPPSGLDFTIPPPTYAFKNWRVYENVPGLKPGGFHVRMGPLIYPVENTQMTQFAQLVNRTSALVYDVPIGSVDVAASREALSMDKHTETFLAETHKRVEEEIGEYIALQFADCKTLLEAELRRVDFRSEVFQHPNIPFGNKKALNGMLDFDAKDDPEPVNNDGIPVRSFRVRQREHYRFIIVRTKEKVLRRNMRLKEYFKHDYTRKEMHLLLTDPTAKQLERLVRRLGLQPHQIIPVSAIPDVQVVPRMVGTAKGAKGVYIRKVERNYYDHEYLIQPTEVDLTSNYYWLKIDKRASQGRVLGGATPYRPTVEKMACWWHWNSLLTELDHGIELDHVYVFTETAHRRIQPDDSKRFDEAVWNAMLALPDIELALEFCVFKEATRYSYRTQDTDVMKLVYGITDEKLAVYKRYGRLLDSGYARQHLSGHFSIRAEVDTAQVKAQYPLLFSEPPKEAMIEYIEWRKEKLAEEVVDSDEVI